MRVLPAHLDVPPTPGGAPARTTRRPGPSMQTSVLKAENLHTGVFDHGEHDAHGLSSSRRTSDPRDPPPPKTGGRSKFQITVLRAENLHTGVFGHGERCA